MKKGLIISGGGAFGAYGVGTLASLNKDYDIVAGISTGALMGSLVALKKFDVLKEAYT
jgi:predicted acylesterase/phospholipase RssA